ncbi:hypothetical protein [Homoserinimonas aerilata]|nr:hypothetical protein [Homoserinimonas aerilata]
MTLLAETSSPALARDELQTRIRQMQATRLDEKTLPMPPGMESLLPEGLRAGASYSIDGSAAGAVTLALALLAGPSRQGAWCGVLGMPGLGTEAAAGLGVDLERLVLVPRPGDRWLTVAAAMADVLGMVLLAPPGRATAADANRLAARLRQRGSTLLVLGDWPHAEATLRVATNRWEGLSDGHGRLRTRHLDVQSTGRSGRMRAIRLDLAERGHPIATATGTAHSPSIRLVQGIAG